MDCGGFELGGTPCRSSQYKFRQYFGRMGLVSGPVGSLKVALPEACGAQLRAVPSGGHRTASRHRMGRSCAVRERWSVAVSERASGGNGWVKMWVSGWASGKWVRRFGAWVWSLGVSHAPCHQTHLCDLCRQSWGGLQGQVAPSNGQI